MQTRGNVTHCTAIPPLIIRLPKCINYSTDTRQQHGPHTSPLSLTHCTLPPHLLNGGLQLSRLLLQPVLNCALLHPACLQLSLQYPPPPLLHLELLPQVLQLTQGFRGSLQRTEDDASECKPKR